MDIDLAPWPGLHETNMRVKESLDRELAHLRSELFDAPVEASEKTLDAFQARTSQTIAKIDRDVTSVRSEVDERLTGIDKRIPILEERMSGLERAKTNLESQTTVRAVSPGAAAVITAAMFLVALLVARESLDLALPRSLILAIVVVASGAGAAHGAHSLGLTGSVLRWGGLAAGALMAAACSRMI